MLTLGSHKYYWNLKLQLILKLLFRASVCYRIEIFTKVSGIVVGLLLLLLLLAVIVVLILVKMLCYLLVLLIKIEGPIWQCSV